MLGGGTATVLLTLYLAGMPLAAALMLWSLVGIDDEDWRELCTLPGLAALAVFVLLWPIFLGLALYDAITER